jgi:hypothetical protein
MYFTYIELILITLISIALLFIYHKTFNCNEPFNEIPLITSETCNLNNEGFICNTTCKVFGKGYYVNNGQGCKGACICP